MKLLTKIGLCGLLASTTATAIYAEPAGGWLSPNGTNTSGPTTSTGGTSAAVGIRAPLSLPDLQLRIHQLHDQARVDARHVQYLQQMARKEKDVIKLNCVNDKLVQIKPLLNLADTAELEIAAATDDTRAVPLDSFAQSTDNIRRLREEADQCIGEPVTQGDNSSNSFTGPTMPDDPTKGFLGGGDIEAPGYASPFN